MKIILLHGDHTSQSLLRLQAFIDSAVKRKFEIVRIERSSPKDFESILANTSLFESEKLYLIKDTSILNKESIQVINRLHKFTPGVLVIHTGSSASSIAKQLPSGTKVEEYKLPKIIFTFLESLFPGNSNSSLKLLHQLLPHESPEFIVAMIAQHFRDLYFTKTRPSQLNYPSWRKDKLTKQADKYTNIKLNEFISSLSEIDLKSKTTNLDLSSSLDLLIISHLQ